MALSKSQEEMAFSRRLTVCLSRFESMNQMYRETSQGKKPGGEGKPPECLHPLRSQNYVVSSRP